MKILRENKYIDANEDTPKTLQPQVPKTHKQSNIASWLTLIVIGIREFLPILEKLISYFS